MSSQKTISQKIAELKNRAALSERDQEELSNLYVALDVAKQYDEMIANGSIDRLYGSDEELNA